MNENKRNMSVEFSNGDKMPILGLGTWKSKPGEVYDAVREAIRIGYRHIDCAAIYMNEEEIGRAFADAFAAGDVKREQLWVTSKLWNNAHAEDAVLPALRKTLADLQLDYLDLYLVHWPIAFRPDVMGPKSAEDLIALSELPLIGTWRGMEAAHAEGLTRNIGVSNFSVKKLRALLEEAKVRPEMNQIELHPLLQQSEMLGFCKAEGIHLTAYSPLGSFDRSAALKGSDEPNLFEHPVILEVASSLGCTPAQVLIKWAIQRGTVVIPKSVNPLRLRENFESLQVTISDNDMHRIATLDRHYRFIDGSFWEFPGSSYTVANLWDE
jgi:alcohol dehydrogenase (NADP+)